MSSAVLALLSHEQLQQIGVSRMGDRVKLIRRANEQALELKATTEAPKRWLLAPIESTQDCALVELGYQQQVH